MLQSFFCSCLKLVEIHRNDLYITDIVIQWDGSRFNPMNCCYCTKHHCKLLHIIKNTLNYTLHSVAWTVVIKLQLIADSDSITLSLTLTCVK